MHKTLLLTLVEEKLIMRYLNSVDPTEYERAQVLLAQCVGYAVLTAILPFFESTKHAAIAQLISQADQNTQQQWLTNQPSEVKLSIKETVERLFLSIS